MSAVLKITRDDFNKIIQAGIKTAEFAFLEKTITQWLKKFPNDIEGKFYQAQLEHLQLNDKAASQILQDIIITDPEYLPAYNLSHQLDLHEDRKAICSAIHVLSGRTEDISEIYPWAVTLRAVRQALKKKDYVHGEKLLRKIISSEQRNLLAVVEHCHLSCLVDESQTLLKLSEIYHKRWPNCVQIDLYRAKALFESGRESDAVSLLHSCAAKDPADLVAIRMWGVGHEFASLWPKQQTLNLNTQIPSSISVALNWNQLGAGEQQQMSAKKIDNKLLTLHPNLLEKV